MPGPLSVDLRVRALAAYDAGGVTQEEVAKRFNVGVASVKRWVRRRRETGGLLPGKATGRPSKLSEEHRAVLRALVVEHPDWIRDEFADELQERCGVRVSTATIGRELHRAGFSRKKNAAGLRT